MSDEEIVLDIFNYLWIKPFFKEKLLNILVHKVMIGQFAPKFLFVLNYSDDKNWTTYKGKIKERFVPCYKTLFELIEKAKNTWNFESLDFSWQAKFAKKVQDFWTFFQTFLTDEKTWKKWDEINKYEFFMLVICYVFINNWEQLISNGYFDDEKIMDSESLSNMSEDVFE